MIFRLSCLMDRFFIHDIMMPWARRLGAYMLYRRYSCARLHRYSAISYKAAHGYIVGIARTQTRPLGRSPSLSLGRTRSLSLRVWVWVWVWVWLLTAHMEAAATFKGRQVACGDTRQATRTHTHTHARTHAHTHTHTYTYTHTHGRHANVNDS
jgi:hypothetical protein